MDEEKHSTIFEPNVEDKWNLRTIGIKTNVQSERDNLILNMLKNTVTKEGFVSLSQRERKIQVCYLKIRNCYLAD